MADNDQIRDMALLLLVGERARQVDGEGFDASHDDAHDRGQLALHAALYATPVPLRSMQGAADPWGWGEEWDKRGPKHPGPSTGDPQAFLDSRIDDLKKAGALVLAEMERIIRIKAARYGRVPQETGCDRS